MGLLEWTIAFGAFGAGLILGGLRYQHWKENPLPRSEREVLSRRLEALPTGRLKRSLKFRLRFDENPGWAARRQTQTFVFGGCILAISLGLAVVLARR